VNNLMEINLAIAGRAREGAALTAAEIDELASADLLSLGMLADEVRRARVGDRVTFIRTHEWKAGEPVPSAAREVRLASLPDSLDSTIAEIRAARAAAGSRLVTGFSLADVLDRAHSGWGALLDVLAQMKRVGLDAIVHAPVDAIGDAANALVVVREAGLAVGCLSVQRPIGLERTNLLIQMRSVSAGFPEISSIAPLPREQSTTVPTTGYDDVRMVALARLVVATAPHVQVDWAQYGPKLAQVALTFGADDFDRVSAVDDESVGRRRMAAEDVKRNIAAAGLVAVERDRLA
jgi:aminodeoxyfutalosine synthase